MKLSISSLLILFPATLGVAAKTKDGKGDPPPGGPGPKMVANEVTPGNKGLSEYKEYDGRSQTITANNAVFIGDCSPDSPFEFPIGTRPVRGAIGSLCNVIGSVKVSSDKRDVRTGGKQKNFLNPSGEGQVGGSWVNNDLCGVSFVVTDEGPSATTATVSCPAGDTPVVVLTEDEDDDDEAGAAGVSVAEATLTCDDDGVQRLELGAAAAGHSKTSLQGQTRAKVPLAEYGQGNAKAKDAITVNFEDASDRAIAIKGNQESGGDDAGLSLIQATFEYGNGDVIHRTFVTETKNCQPVADDKRRLQPVTIRSSIINEDGDIELDFDLDKLLDESSEDDRLKVQARIGISAGAEGEAEIVHRTVDMTAFLSRGHPVMVVHGGWVRRALSSMEAPPSGWDVVVEEAVISDPEANYRVVARMEDVHPTGVGSDRSHRRAQISKAASEEEHSISEEMRQGRRPDQGRPGVRSLQSGSHKKILIHGYCADSSPFPLSHFSNAVAFSDPWRSSAHQKNNWSTDNFAVRIWYFQYYQNIGGCAAIAHSQGGLASLHLYTYYWSCLDYANQGGSRMIQSVGSPYQGSSLAGNLAAIGNVFGGGCGSNNSLTYGGAGAWLSGIPSWARSKVHYFTTSHYNHNHAWWCWWCVNYCNMATNVFLNNPEDGATEMARGQLAHGNNRGNREGQCHVGGMRDPDQCRDHGRNSEMNANARY